MRASGVRFYKQSGMKRCQTNGNYYFLFALESHFSTLSYLFHKSDISSVFPVVSRIRDILRFEGLLLHSKILQEQSNCQVKRFSSNPHQAVEKVIRDSSFRKSVKRNASVCRVVE